MKKILLLIVLAAVGNAGDNEDHILFKALADEMNRNIDQLQIDNQPKPYYLSYRVNDIEGVEIKAVFGGLLQKNPYRQRVLYADLRVGDYNLDNSNFACQVGSSSTIDADQINLPLEDDYDAIRNAVWLVTDGTYKKALERLSRKRATLQNRPQNDRSADFSLAEPCTIVEPIAVMDIDIEYWQNAAVELSTIFRRFPKIQESGVKFVAQTNNQYFLDNERNRNRHARTIAGIEVDARTQSRDGDPLEDIIVFYACRAGDLPSLNEMKQAVAAMAETLSLLAGTTKEEEYSGPVIFAGQAAAELIFQVLGKGVSDPKAPLFENDILAQAGANKGMAHLVSRYGRKVMPDFLSAWDDPGLRTWKNTSLVGSFSVDDQGVEAQRVNIVTNGKLTGLMMSRTPSSKIKTSNGHARFRNERYARRSIGMIGNLIVESRQSVSFEDLKEHGLNLCREYGLPHIMIVSRLAPARPLSTKERYMRYFTRGGSTETTLLSAPVIAYKIDTLGNISLTRGLEFCSVTNRLLRDVAAAGDQDYVYNCIYYDEEGNNYPVSVVAPALLIDEMELVPKDPKPSHLPVFAHPYFVK